ncbi:U6 snRNA phosphodiesterase Usb1 [Cercophora scortea]|uniref:U6 snRNA phosphodiesterase n=1 Tax=Cercophora scortea TaxID=314031 RepID=A0AAE0J4G3_9PEZI|nr:U6 snRNA phosphodiesterase Usb1 [Cercophora scortea]
MPLVTYTSDSDSDSDTASDPPPPSKKSKPNNTPPAPPPLPPLPSAFHDLYASTVRTTTADTPFFHQGRTRQTPHIPGNWPSHIYIEWHPSPTTHAHLTSLLTMLQSRLTSPPSPSNTTTNYKTNITTFLTSDLGAPLPLHISLSRPLSLPTNQKAGFLSALTGEVASSGVAPFALAVRGAEWHRTEESGRSFLVLRVRTKSATTTSGTGKGKNANPELTRLLRGCNLVAKQHGQPELYQWAGDADDDADADAEIGSGSSKADNGKSVGNAFHISIAWTFTKPTEELEQLTREVFAEHEEEGDEDGIQKTTVIQVDGIKAKIGNVVTHIPLRQPGRKDSSDQPARHLLRLA